MVNSIPSLKLLSNCPRHLFFTGKGGVGKTSLACATALFLADQGKIVLLVSTDPASNLQHVFETEIGVGAPTPIPGSSNLQALNLDPEAAAQSYRDRIIGPIRGVLPDSAVKAVEEQLSGACTTEIAAFDEFTTLLANPETTGEFDHVVFDTAPTGHTLRLLSLPNAWSGFLDNNTSGATCLGPLSGLGKQRQQYKKAVAVLADGMSTTLILVSRPQKSSLGEAARTSVELAALGINNQRLVINGVAELSTDGDLLAAAMTERERQAMSNMPGPLLSLPIEQMPLQPNNLIGLEALRRFMLRGELPETAGSGGKQGVFNAVELGVEPLASLIDDIDKDRRGLVMVMGKGGVGKTTIAVAIALGLAQRGHEVSLTSTDPAAHIAETVESEFKNLSVSHIDPAVETERYRNHILATKGKDLDEGGRALLEEDLRSPCTEEIAVFQAFSKAIRESDRCFVVMDTAPTGHTLLLLDATGAYHRDIMRHQSTDSGLITPMMRLQDPARTKILIATLPETSPVLEAAALQDDLRRAGIEPWAWVVNSSLAATSTSDPLLLARSRGEIPLIAEVSRSHARRTALVPWLAEEPVGVVNLSKLSKINP